MIGSNIQTVCVVIILLLAATWSIRKICSKKCGCCCGSSCGCGGKCGCGNGKECKCKLKKE